MNEIKNKNLAFSCPINKDKLNKKDNNFHCARCEHTVIDFTNKSEEQLQETLNKNQGSVCGIFKKNQLSKQFLKYATATFVASSGVVFQAQAQQQVKIDSIYQTYDSLTEREDVFGMIIEEMAQPVGGYEKLYQAITKELRFPKGLNSSGKVYIQFIVDTTGSIKGLVVVKGYDKRASAEAIRIMNKIDYPFIPASQRGKKVKSRLVIPINFNIEDKN